MFLSMKQPPRNHHFELEILRVLWTRGPPRCGKCTDAVNEKKAMGYTTVLKLLQIMTTKGTVRRNDNQRAHVYESCLPRGADNANWPAHASARIEGSASQLMMHALAGSKASNEEIDELRRLLD